MSMEDLLHRAGADLRAASAPDVGAALADLARRRRRRTTRRTVAAIATLAAVAAAAGALTLPSGRDRTQPAQPGPVPTRVSLDDAVPAKAETLERLRMTWRDPDGPLGRDRFEGLTADGLVVRARDDGTRSTEVGLVEPGSGRTSWLPPVPWELGTTYPIDLAADQLAYVDVHVGRLWLVTFHRLEGAWSRVRVDLNDQVSSKFFGDIARLGPDGRVYFLNGNLTVSWWSVPLVTGGALRPEPDLDGKTVAFSDDAVATANADGEVFVERDGGTTTVADGPPPGCTATDALPPGLSFAGTNLLVSWQCGEEDGRVSAFDTSGRPVLEVRGEGPLGVVAADPRRALMVATARGTEPTHSEAYALDLPDGRLRLLGTAGADVSWSLHGDLALWPKLGPSDDAHTWDVIYSLIRLPD
jgi:hypothetical protein